MLDSARGWVWVISNEDPWLYGGNMVVSVVAGLILALVAVILLVARPQAAAPVLVRVLPRRRR